MVTATLDLACPGTGSFAMPTLSETVVCAECGARVPVITSRAAGRPPVRTVAWHLVPESRVR